LRFDLRIAARCVAHVVTIGYARRIPDCVCCCRFLCVPLLHICAFAFTVTVALLWVGCCSPLPRCSAALLIGCYAVAPDYPATLVTRCVTLLRLRAGCYLPTLPRAGSCCCPATRLDYPTLCYVYGLHVAPDCPVAAVLVAPYLAFTWVGLRSLRFPLYGLRLIPLRLDYHVPCDCRLLRLIALPLLRLPLRLRAGLPRATRLPPRLPYRFALPWFGSHIRALHPHRAPRVAPFCAPRLPGFTVARLVTIRTRLRAFTVLTHCPVTRLLVHHTLDHALRLPHAPPHTVPARLLDCRAASSRLTRLFLRLRLVTTVTRCTALRSSCTVGIAGFCPQFLPDLIAVRHAPQCLGSPTRLDCYRGFCLFPTHIRARSWTVATFPRLRCCLTVLTHTLRVLVYAYTHAFRIRLPLRLFNCHCSSYGWLRGCCVYRLALCPHGWVVWVLYSAIYYARLRTLPVPVAPHPHLTHGCGLPLRWLRLRGYL